MGKGVILLGLCACVYLIFGMPLCIFELVLLTLTTASVYSFVDNCPFTCKYGYVTDSQNREICQCAKHVHKCPRLSTCKRRCAYGYKRTRHGCFRCKCNVCPPHECSKKCIYGYLSDARGCPVCGCKGMNLLLLLLLLLYVFIHSERH